MERLEFNGKRILRFDAENLKEIRGSVNAIFKEFKLPKDKKGTILLKPNLNNDMISLTGGTTDMRIIVAVITHLKKHGYNNIIIGDGPNTGMYHAGIDVFGRLRIKEIAKIFSVKYIDFNNAEYVEKNLGKRKTEIAKICYDSFFINMPKIKTHTEAGMSCCMKNLVGCNAGLNKRSVHWNLGKNIVELNQILKPDLNIVDGLIVMEGDGPSKGTPKKLNIMLAGNDSFAIDYYISNLVGIGNIRYLEHAKNVGLIHDEKILAGDKHYLKKPGNHAVVNFFLRNYFVLPRYWNMFNWLFELKTTGKLLTKLNIRQDIFDNSEINVKLNKTGNVDRSVDDFCPMMLNISKKGFKFDGKCIKCMYCYAVSKNIAAEGDLGFFREQERNYSKYWHNL
ncbi:DUF362 domain-containing protein [Candidatus Woesearchaeota archaeon]|nr:DUF362 domain-containing protein [Candidatus Woesearchaeota archaeon]